MTRIKMLMILLIFCISATLPKEAIVLAGQSNMGKSAEDIRILMPDFRVINCAVGGTSITEWQPGGLLYNDCLAKVRLIQAEGYIIKGIFWYQGERDTFDPIISRQWKRLFYSFVNKLRSDVGYAPVIFAQLGPRPLQARPYWNVVKNQQRLSADDTKRMYMITTGDIVPYCPVDAVHFCADGYVEIAKRFVSKFEEIR